MMKVRGVIFDLDGTLLDTIDDIADAMNVVLERWGYPSHSVDSYRYFVGDGARELAFRALPVDARNADTVDDLAREYRETYIKRGNIKTKPYLGIPEVVDRLKRNGLKMIVFSNKDQQAARSCIDEMFDENVFDLVFGARTGISLKPSPQGALVIADRFGLKTGECAFIGDTSVDMQTAVAAGMYPIGVLWGFRTERELLDNGAEAIAASPGDLFDIIVARSKKEK